MPDNPEGAIPLDAGVKLQPGDIALTTDRLGRVTWYNEEAARLFAPPGRAGEDAPAAAARDLTGMPLDTVCGGAGGTARVDVAAVLAGRDFAGDVECVYGSGKRFVLYAFATAGRDRTGSVAGIVFIARDVTGYAHAEEALRTSEEKYRRLFEQSNDIVLVTDSDGLIEEANLAAAHLTGYTADELRGRTLSDLVPPDGRRAIELAFAQVRERGATMSVITILTRTGKPITLEASTSLIRVGAGQQVLLIGRDITERQLAEQRVRESEHKYRRMFEASGDAVMVLAFNQRIIDANERAGELFGRSRPELVGHSLGDLVAPEEKDWLPLLHERLVRAGQHRSDVRMIGAGGAQLTVEMTASLLDLAGGPVVLCVGHDVSERRRAEAAVRESEEQLRTLRDNVPVGLFRTTPDGRLLMVNRAVVAMYGYTSEAEMLDRGADELHADPAQRRALVQRLLDSGRIADGELLARRKDGSTFPAVLNVEVMKGPDGAVLHFDGAVQDITERRLAEQRVRESEARYRAIFDNAAEGAFLETLDGRILDVNVNACRMTGYSRAELLTMRVADLVPPEAGSLAGVERSLEETGEYHAQTYNRRRDGTVFPVEVAISLLRLAGGPAVLALVRDMTEQRRFTDELADREARLSLLVKQLPTVLWTVDRELVFTSSLGAGLAKLGLEPGQVVGIPLSRYFGSDDPDFPPIAAHRRALSGEPARYEFEWSGETFVTALEPLRDGTGAIIGVVGLATDVTRERRAAAAMQASEERYRLLFEGTTDSVAIADIAGQVIEANPACLMMYGYTADEVRQMNLADVVAPQSRDEAVKAMADLAAGRTVAKTITMRRRDGSEFVVDLLAYVATVGGEMRIFSFTRDVTERKQAEDALRESEARYRAIFETTAAATMIIEADTTVSLVNHELTRMLGYDSREAVGRSWTEFVVPEDLPRMRGYHDLRRSADPVTAPRTYEARLVDKAGAIHDCLLTVDIIPGTGRSVASVLDVTDRKRVETELRESGRRLRDLFNTVPVGIYRTTPDGRILMANPALLEMLGCESISELSTRNLENGAFGPGENRAAFRAAVEGTSELRGFESTWRRADGTLIHVRENARAVRDASGAVQYYEGTAEDVTAQKAAERAQLESEENFRALAANSSDGIGITAGSSGRFVYVNGRVGEITGYGVDELVGMSFLDVVAPECREPMLARLRSRLAGGIEPRTYEAVVLRKDGARVPVELSVAVTIWHGEGATVASVRDISERRAAAEALRRSREDYRSALDSMVDAATVVDANLSLLIVNRAMREWLCRLGLDDDVVGKPLRAAFPFLPASVEDEYRRVFATGEPLMTTETSVVGNEPIATETAKTPIIEGSRVARVLTVIHDVTRQTRLVTELAAAQGRLDSLLSGVRDGIVTFDRAGRITWANDIVTQRSGLGLDSWLGKHFTDFLPAEQRETYTAKFEAVVLRGEEVAPYEFSVQLPGGPLFHLEANPSAIREGGKISGGMLVLRDLTERRLVEQRVRESEAKYRSVVDRASDGICVIQEGRIRFVNARLADMAGAPADQLVDRQFVEFLHPDDRVVVTDRYRRRLAGEEIPQAYVVRFVLPGGRAGQFEISAAATEFEGAPADLVLVREVGDRDHLLGELAAARARYESLLQGVRDGVLTLDTGFRVTWVNDVVVQRSGHTLEWWSGRQYLETITPDQHDRIKRLLAAVMRGEDIDSYEVVYHWPDGSVVHIESNAAAIRAGNSVTGIVVVNRDVTARKSAEQQLQESEERYRRLVDLSPDMIAVHQRGLVVYANPATARALGYASGEELVGRPVIEMLYPEDRPAVVARMRQVADGGTPAPPAIERFVAKDGSPVRVEARAAPFLWHGEPATLVVVRNLADAELIAHVSAGAAAGDVLDRAPHGIAAVLNGRIVHTNQLFVELLGYAAAGELTGRPAEELLDPAGRDEALKRLLAAASGTEPGFCRVRARDRAGKATELEMAIVGYQGRGFEYSLWFARRPAEKPGARRRKSGPAAPESGKRRRT